MINCYVVNHLLDSPCDSPGHGLLSPCKAHISDNMIAGWKKFKVVKHVLMQQLVCADGYSKDLIIKRTKELETSAQEFFGAGLKYEIMEFTHNTAKLKVTFPEEYSLSTMAVLWFAGISRSYWISIQDDATKAFGEWTEDKESHGDLGEIDRIMDNVMAAEHSRIKSKEELWKLTRHVAREMMPMWYDFKFGLRDLGFQNNHGWLGPITMSGLIVRALCLGFTKLPIQVRSQIRRWPKLTRAGLIRISDKELECLRQGQRLVPVAGAKDTTAPETTFDTTKRTVIRTASGVGIMFREKSASCRSLVRDASGRFAKGPLTERWETA